MNVIHDSSIEAPNGSSPAQGDGETVGINSDHDPNLEAPQRSDPSQDDGETAGNVLSASGSATKEEQHVPVTDENKEIPQETTESHTDMQHVHQESDSDMNATHGSDGNDTKVSATVHGSMGESNNQPNATNTYDAEQNTVQVPTHARNCVQDTDSLNTETNNQTSDLTTSDDTCPNKPNSSTNHVPTPKAAGEDSESLAKSSTAVCPFSEQPLQNNDVDNSPRKTHNESISNKDSDSETLASIASISREDTHQATLDAEKVRSASPATEGIPLISSRIQGQSPVIGRGIRNLFPQVSVESTSAVRERSSSEIGASDEGNTEDNQTEEAVEGDVVLITGGCGFLGQHIVKLLNLRALHVGEIRVLDLMHFEKKLDYPTTKRVKSLVGDISNSEFVHKALKGVHSVIHVAGVVSWGTFPDYEGMERVNVRGTLNVFNACLENNVQRLIYCSTVDVAVGNKPIRGGTEEDTPVPDKFLFPGYPDTKFHGERIILGSAHLKRSDGELLQTVILRPNVLYGELDKYYVTNALRMAKQSMGIMYQIGNGKAMFQQAYVGNTAWAFVCADAAMKANPGLTREIFYVPDNTPVQNSFQFMLPYLEAHGLKLSSGYLSYALSHSAVAAAEILAKALSPVLKINLPVQSCTIAYINTDLYFRGVKAQRMLKYEPIYTPSEARDLSMKYYANLELEDRPRRGNNPQQS
ncbi:hypothetical protein BsWGS_07397 [Bradybaena similaris]